MSITFTLSTATTTSSSSTTSIYNSEDPHASEQVLNPTLDDDSDLGEWPWVTPADPNVPDTDLDAWENFNWFEGLYFYCESYDGHNSDECDCCLRNDPPEPIWDIHNTRIFARRNQRWRKHLQKYGRTNLGSRAAPRPIPYSIALQTPNSSLVPEIESWAHTAFKDKFNYLIHPQPKNPTIQSEKRRVYAMGKVARCLVIGDRCTCYECRNRRGDLQKTKVKDFKEHFEEETREAKWREWEELERQRGGIAWWEEPHEGEEEEEEEEEEDVARPELVSFVWSENNSQRPSEWAKLVSDAVNAWECKRKMAVEQMGWEVCSHGSDGGDGDDDCDSDDGILTPRPRDQTSPTHLRGRNE